MTAFIPDPIVITNQPQSQTVEANSSVTFSVGVTGTQPQYQWQFKGFNIAGGTNSVHTIPNVATGNQGSYRVIVRNSANTATSEVATLTVIPDQTGPGLISATFSASNEPPYYVLVRFNERLQASSASAASNYTIALLGGTDELVVSNALLNASLVRLTIQQWRPDSHYVLTVNNVADTNGNVISPGSRIGVAMWQDLMSTDARWNWSEGFDLTGQNWTRSEYDESTNNIRFGGQWRIPDPAWTPIGHSGFYFYLFKRSVTEVNPRSTVLSLGYPTYYFRTHFVVPANTSPNGEVLLSHFVDDGAAFYLNGIELGRFNLPSGTPGYQTLAASANGAWRSFTVSVTNILPGTNILAAELHPQSLTSGAVPGIAFAASLSAALAPDVSQSALAAAKSPQSNGAAAPSVALPAVGATSPATVPSEPEGISNVIHISIDGGGAYWIERYVNDTPEIFTNFHRLFAEGAGTFDARCDAEHSFTIPNHFCMLTGRPVFQPTNIPPIQHGFFNSIGSYVDDGITVHNFGNTNVPYKASVFDVVHDRGLSTEFFCGKAERLSVCERSYNAKYGAPDVIPPDNGPDKIDYSIIADSWAEQLVTLFLQNLYFTPPKRYTFFHFVDPDEEGHYLGWGTDGWSNSIVTMDHQIGRILDAAQSHPALANHTAVIVTADHGGGRVDNHNHGNPKEETTFRIPFFVWGPGIPAGTDLYDLLSNRTDPGTNWLDYTAVHQPIRNGDSGNLALSLLGLPPIPGSFMIPKFEWDEPSLTLSSSNAVPVVSWSRYATNFQLEASQTLADGAAWEPVTEDIVEGPEGWHHTVSSAVGDSRFYRLQKRAP
jgi:hypothetical protein